MIQIFHNNRCRKSRDGVAFLQASGKNFEIINYLEKVPTKAELKSILKLLGIKSIELVRKNEAIWKEHYKGKELSDEEIVQAMVDNPKLIERPIVINGNKAVVARPVEKIREII